jgi:hypothetical protein
VGVVIEEPVTHLSGYARHGTTDIAQDGRTLRRCRLDLTGDRLHPFDGRFHGHLGHCGHHQHRIVPVQHNLMASRNLADEFASVH